MIFWGYWTDIQTPVLNTICLSILHRCTFNLFADLKFYCLQAKHCEGFRASLEYKNKSLINLIPVANRFRNTFVELDVKIKHKYKKNCTFKGQSNEIFFQFYGIYGEDQA